MTQTPISTQAAACNAILRAAEKNRCITPDGLREECARGDIWGWLELPAVRACTLSEWSAAMTLAADCLELTRSNEARAEANNASSFALMALMAQINSSKTA